MKYKIIFLSLLFGVSVAYSQTKSENLFYMVNTPESFESFQANADQISIVCPQTFAVSRQGVLTGSLDPRVLSLARKNNIKVMPLVVNPGFDQKILHDLITDPVARKRSIDMMLAYAAKYKIDGWQFDLEHLALADQAAFTLYYKETAEALHKAGLQLSAAVVHATDNVGGTSPYHLFLYENWRAGYSFKELSEIGDFLSIMTYDEHTRRTTPGPVASTGWMERVVQYLLSEGVAPNKISLGIPTYSVHWFNDYTDERGGFSNAKSAKYNMVKHLLGQFNAKTMWNEKAGVNWAVWDNDGVNEYLFIEDAQSLKPKLDVLKKFNLRGISVWVLGSEDPAFWPALKKELVKSTIK